MNMKSLTTALRNLHAAAQPIAGELARQGELPSEFEAALDSAADVLSLVTDGGKWTADDDAHAQAQGWVLSNYDGTDALRVEKFDEDTPFRSDSDALAFVMSQAMEGDEVCLKALRIMVSDDNIAQWRETL